MERCIDCITILVLTILYRDFHLTKAEVIVKHFPITKYKIIDVSNSGSVTTQTKSSIQCIILCSVKSTCCTGSYDNATKQCIISTTCIPALVSGSSAVMFRRDIEDFNVQNGATVISGYSAQVTCNAGYTLCGESSLTYTAEGTWDHPYPVCVGNDKTMSYGGKTYTFVTNTATQTDAMTYCTSQGLHLLDITSADENAFVKCVAFKFNNGIGWWTGFTAFTSGTYTWSSGVAVTYTNWVSSLSGGQGSCAKFDQRDGLWYERASSTCSSYPLPFVCKS